MKIVCVKCEVELKPHTNGVAVIEMADHMAGPEPYKLWRAGDVATRLGCGQINWALFGRVLKHRQLELVYESPDQMDCILAIATERRVRQALYPEAR